MPAFLSFICINQMKKNTTLADYIHMGCIDMKHAIKGRRENLPFLFITYNSIIRYAANVRTLSVPNKQRQILNVA